MATPNATITICLLYVLFVLIGPKVMKNKKPFNINNILVAYNLFACLFSGYLFYEFLMSGWLMDYSLGCQPVDYSNNPKALRVGRLSYILSLSPISF
jgi:elongation of very long chain fatty acids protein 7